MPKDDPKQRQPDIFLARQVMGWHPETDFETGLRKPFLTSSLSIYQKALNIHMSIIELNTGETYFSISIDWIISIPAGFPSNSVCMLV
jgi:hypothetical protein